MDKKYDKNREQKAKNYASVNEEPADSPEINDLNVDDNGEVNVVPDVNDGDPDLSETEQLMKQLNDTSEKLEKEKKEYLFLMAEFDNFRKRTLKEKSEIIKNGAESAMKGLLPIIDDFERGLDAIKDSSDVEAVKEGMALIYNKFVKYLEQNGVKPMNTEDADFNPDLHEAIAMLPADSPEKKGKIIDTVSKGYLMNDKVIRHAKVAVAQ